MGQRMAAAATIVTLQSPWDDTRQAAASVFIVCRCTMVGMLMTCKLGDNWCK